ncbi:hypothetical protein JCM21714_1915 [Gracilibacillus boraciitolerans JCM 21714]|uniref:Uncharacterized protein n=1 Tax=Gracilibacillus boraciitolerans JCM 21714 TaxID=1298598 RepID=W4VI46_9BACI|nr:hypothetical protein [Gracilibacillus boraciitolerans]GAE92892.1 hypothetical protein JCM21714_1915 [Gracilibacillus boraciitolerans JCM 21714]
MKFEKSGLVVIFFLLLFLIGISIWTIKPVEEVLSEAVDVAERHFKAEPLVQNKQVDNFSLFLPEGFIVEEQTVSNLLLKKEDKSYILFYNALESHTSRLNYEAAKEINDHQWLKSFEDNDRFGFINITKHDENFEVQLGVGGVKVTTFSTKDKLINDVKDMMDITNSIAYEETGA